MIKLFAMVAILATCFSLPNPEAILSKLPFGDSMQIVVTDDLPPLPNGDWSAGRVDWGDPTIHLSPAVLTVQWRHSYGESTDRLVYLIAHEWAHVMQDRAWGRWRSPVPQWVTDPFLGEAPGWMALLYASPDPSVPWWEVQADCVAELLTGYSQMGYYVGNQACSQVQLSSALSPLLKVGVTK